MPRKAADYSKAIQYKIVCRDSAIMDCYNGSCISFKDRKTKHKHSCNNPKADGYNFKVYQFIREHGGWANWEMIQIEESPCKSKQELLAREREIFDILRPTLNMISPTFDIENRKKYEVEYNATHKEERKKTWAEYNATHREERKKWREDHKEEYKEYYEQNKVKIIAKVCEYRAAHKDAISVRKKELITCECGCTIQKDALSKHRRTNKHLAIMNQK